MLLGQLLSASLVQGGAGANILSKSVYAYLSGMSAADIIVDIEEVADYELKELIQKVRLLWLSSPNPPPPHPLLCYCSRE